MGLLHSCPPEIVYTFDTASGCQQWSLPLGASGVRLLEQKLVVQPRGALMALSRRLSAARLLLCMVRQVVALHAMAFGTTLCALVVL